MPTLVVDTGLRLGRNIINCFLDVCHAPRISTHATWSFNYSSQMFLAFLTLAYPDKPPIGSNWQQPDFSNIGFVLNSNCAEDSTKPLEQGKPTFWFDEYVLSCICLGFLDGFQPLRCFLSTLCCHLLSMWTKSHHFSFCFIMCFAFIAVYYSK